MQSTERDFQTPINRLTGQTGGDQKPVLHQLRESVATGMNKAAQALHQQSDKSQTSEFSDFGHRTASWLEKSADYVNELEPQKLKTDLENQVRQNPAKSLLIAGAAGLIIGAIFRRRR